MTPTQDSNGNYVDSTGTPVKTPDGKPPVGGEQVQILNTDTDKVIKGHWDGTNVVEDKESA